MASAGPGLRVALGLLTIVVAAPAPHHARGQAPTTPTPPPAAPEGAQQCLFLPDGSLVGSEANRLFVWNRNTGDRLVEQSDRRVSLLACSSDGRFVVDGLRVYSPPNFAEHRTIALSDDDPRDVKSAVFSQDGAQLALGLGHGLVVVFDTQTWQVARRITAPDAQLTASGLGFSTAPRRLLVSWSFGHHNATISIYDLTTGVGEHLSRNTPGEAPHVGPRFSKSVRALCGGAFLVGETPQFACSPSGSHFALGVRTADRRAALGVWDARTLQPRWIADLGPGNVESLAWSPDERYLVLGGYVTRDPAARQEIPLRIIDATTGQLRLSEPRQQPAPATGLAFTRDGQTLAVSRPNAPIEFVSWKTLEGKLK